MDQDWWDEAYENDGDREIDELELNDTDKDYA